VILYPDFLTSLPFSYGQFDPVCIFCHISHGRTICFYMHNKSHYFNDMHHNISYPRFMQLPGLVIGFHNEKSDCNLHANIIRMKQLTEIIRIITFRTDQLFSLTNDITLTIDNAVYDNQLSRSRSASYLSESHITLSNPGFSDSSSRKPQIMLLRMWMIQYIMNRWIGHFKSKDWLLFTTMLLLYSSHTFFILL